MKKPLYTMTEKVFLWSGDMAAWHFVTIKKNVATEIKEKYGGLARGFGSLPVTVTIGKTSWQTSIFPDRHSGSYLLPLKASVRKKEDIYAEDMITFSITVRV